METILEFPTLLFSVASPPKGNFYMINKKRRKENKGILVYVPIRMIFEIVSLWSDEKCHPRQEIYVVGIEN